MLVPHLTLRRLAAAPSRRVLLTADRVLQLRQTGLRNAAEAVVSDRVAARMRADVSAALAAAPDEAARRRVALTVAVG